MIMDSEIPSSLLDRFETQARLLAAQLESHSEIDLTALARGMGATLEYILGHLLSAHESTSVYWIDGVVLSEPTLLADGSIIATGYAWCAEGRAQWQVPAQLHFSLSCGADRGVEFCKMRLGDGKHASLKAHHTRRPFDTPRVWLLEFDL